MWWFVYPLVIIMVRIVLLFGLLTLLFRGFKHENAAAATLSIAATAMIAIITVFLANIAWLLILAHVNIWI